jgi:hypothetical protein
MSSLPALLDEAYSLADCGQDAVAGLEDWDWLRLLLESDTM